MISIATIVDALAVGSAASKDPQANPVLLETYGALREILQHSYARANLEPLDEAPGSAVRRQVVEEYLTVMQADQDEELLHQTQKVLEAIHTYAPEVAGSIGIDLHKLDETAEATEISNQEIVRPFWLRAAGGVVALLILAAVAAFFLNSFGIRDRLFLASNAENPPAIAPAAGDELLVLISALAAQTASPAVETQLQQAIVEAAASAW
jgi:hypothetical protein